MIGRIIFLLEEPSMKILLDGLLPRFFPGWVVNQHFQCVKFDGKSDLDRNIPRKLSAWRIPGDRFVIVRDNDNTDCIQLKTRLQALCFDSGRPETLIRLACQELESWYVGDLKSLAQAFNDPKLDALAMRKRFAVPDDWHKPSVELERLIPTFQKGSGARTMATYLRETGNRSVSFQMFVRGVRCVAVEMGYQPVAI